MGRVDEEEAARDEEEEEEEGGRGTVETGDGRAGERFWIGQMLTEVEPKCSICSAVNERVVFTKASGRSALNPSPITSGDRLLSAITSVHL